MCFETYVFYDLIDSIQYNITHAKFNKAFLVPYGIFRIILIVVYNLFFLFNKNIYLKWNSNLKLFLTAGWISAATISNNESAGKAYLAISLLAFFLSILILFLGLINIINFPTFTMCHFLLLVIFFVFSIYQFLYY